MIGNAAVFTQEIMILAPLIMLGMGIGMWRTGAYRSKSISFLIGGSIGVVIGSSVVFFGSIGMSHLSALKTTDVQRITIAQQTFSDPAVVAELVAALQTYQPYMLNHESPPTIPLRIEASTADSSLEVLIKYRAFGTRRGVIVLLQPSGCVFSEQLLQVFEKRGIHL